MLFFYENNFPYSQPSISNPNATESTHPAVYDMDYVTSTSSLDTSSTPHNVLFPPDTPSEPTFPMNSSCSGTNELLATGPMKERGSDPVTLEAPANVIDNDTTCPIAPYENNLRRSSRERQPSVRL
jgi:hypothetical protein